MKIQLILRGRVSLGMQGWMKQLIKKSTLIFWNEVSKYWRQNLGDYSVFTTEEY